MQICHFPESGPGLAQPKYLVKYDHTKYSFFFFIAFMFLLHEHSSMKINVFLQHHFLGCITYFANPLIWDIISTFSLSWTMIRCMPCY